MGKGVKLTLKGSAHTAKAVLILPVRAAGAASLVAGQTIEVSTQASGWIVTQAGKVLGFVPNEAGKALLHSEQEPGS